MSEKTKRQPATPKSAGAKGGSAAPTLLERSIVMEAILEEECFDGPMPDEIWAMMQTRESAEEILRATVRRVQLNIINRLRSNKDSATHLP